MKISLQYWLVKVIIVSIRICSLVEIVTKTNHHKQLEDRNGICKIDSVTILVWIMLIRVMLLIILHRRTLKSSSSKINQQINNNHYNKWISVGHHMSLLEHRWKVFWKWNKILSFHQLFFRKYKLQSNNRSMSILFHLIQPLDKDFWDVSSFFPK